VARHELRSWYRIAFADGDKQALVAAAGAHLGEAIAAASKRAAGHPIAIDNAPEPDIPLGDSVGKDHVVQLGDAHEASTFAWPIGVLPRLGRTEAVAAAARGFAVVPQRDLFVIEAQTDANHVIDLFLGMIERLPAADNLEVRVLDHLDGADHTEVWITSRLDGHKVIKLLDEHEPDLIFNGHVELNVYARKHKATLRLTEHKTVVWLAETAALEADVVRWLGELGVPRVDTLATVNKTSHFHYRPAGTRDRKKLGEELFRQRLRKAAILKR
jgi:hypothetical protein